MNTDQTRELLPDNSKKSFDDIVFQRVLGASRHINMIAEMIESVALEGKKNGSTVNEVVDNVLSVSQFFIETRGDASQAIANAINIMIRDVDEVRKLDLDEATDTIIQMKNRYLTTAQEATNLVVDYGVEVAKSMNTVMVFDYSSTVDKFLKKANPENGKLLVIIPESRSIDGGHAFIKTCVDAGHKVKFIPDAAIMYFLKKCDGVFMGAETFYPDGTVFNTTGSDIVGLVCREFNVPLYVLTPLIKVDIRSIHGYEKVLVKNDLTNRLAVNWDHVEQEKVDFICPELLGVESKYITAVITEKGIIPANQLFNTSINYSNSLKGGN